jgi:hypothetical protein
LLAKLVLIKINTFPLKKTGMMKEQKDIELVTLEKEADELRQNLWVWKGISFVLLVLYVAELGDWFSP